jgi:hypothetical protein
MTDSGTHTEVLGARELRATLKAAGEDLKQLKEPSAEVAGVVSRAASAGAPRRTGRLSSTVRGSGTNRAAVVRAGTARVPYAQVIHWGWGRRNIAADPWMSRAAVRTEPIWTVVYRTAVVRIISKVRGTDHV